MTRTDCFALRSNYLRKNLYKADISIKRIHFFAPVVSALQKFHLYEVLILKKNFQKKKIVTGKTMFFLIGPILFVLTLTSNRAVLYGNVTFSILLLSPKKGHYSFLKQVFVFQKLCFELKVLKTFTILSGSRIKTYRSLKRWATVLKISRAVS